MASLFTGTPATTYTTSSTETPKWMQDAIYSQIQSAGNIANAPYQPYQLPTVAGLTDLQNKAITDAQTNQGTWHPGLAAAKTGMAGLSTTTAGASAAQPYMNQAGQATAQSLSERALAAANPYLQAASGSAASGIDEYMSPYQTNVMDAMGRHAGRNLSENLLPNVADSFIKAGQFGSSRMGEFGSRALRDTQESLLNQQATLANQGFGQALGASQADLARQSQLAGTVGSISGADLSRVLQGASQYGSIAGTMGGLAGTDASRQASALSQMAAMAQQQQQQSGVDVASMSAAGQQQQQQQQAELTAAQRQHQEELAYPRQQLDWMNTQIRGMAPITPQTQHATATGNTGASPLTQLASATAAGMGIYNLAK